MAESRGSGRRAEGIDMPTWDVNGCSDQQSVPICQCKITTGNPLRRWAGTLG